MRDDIEDSAGYSDFMTDTVFFAIAIIACIALAAIIKMVLL